VIMLHERAVVSNKRSLWETISRPEERELKGLLTKAGSHRHTLQKANKEEKGVVEKQKQTKVTKANPNTATRELSFSSLPDETILCIVQFCCSCTGELIALEQVNRRFRCLTSDGSLWLEAIKKEWQVTSSWDFDVELLMSPRSWFWKRKKEISDWRHIIAVVKSYLDHSEQAPELMESIEVLITALGSKNFDREGTSPLSFSHFKDFRNFFQLVHKMLFTESSLSFFSERQGNLDSCANKVVGLMNGRTEPFPISPVMGKRGEKVLSPTNVFVGIAKDISVMQQLIQALHGTKPAVPVSGFSWKPSKRLVYIFKMIERRTNSSYFEDECLHCLDLVQSMATQSYKGSSVVCDRCVLAPGYFFSLRSLDSECVEAYTKSDDPNKHLLASACHVVRFYCKPCCSLLGTFSLSFTFLSLKRTTALLSRAT